MDFYLIFMLTMFSCICPVTVVKPLYAPAESLLAYRRYHYVDGLKSLDGKSCQDRCSVVFDKPT